MKRILLLGTTFLMAAVFGLGIAVSVAPNAQAGNCSWEPEDVQPWWDCYSTWCLGERYPHAFFRCGTDDVTGERCECQFISCGKWCAVQE